MAEILFLAHRIPFPPNRGDKIRSWHLLRHLGELATVHLACFADDPEDAAHLPALREAMGDRLGEVHVEVREQGSAALLRALVGRRPLSLARFESRAMQDFVNRVLERPEVRAIFAFSGQMAQYVPDPPERRFVMDFVDVDSAKFEDYARSDFGPRAWIYALEGRRLARFESATAARADLSLFVSKAEAALFRERSGSADVNVAALANGIDLAFYSPGANFPLLRDIDRGEGPLIVFTGQMDYRPNVEAVTAFAHDVMPRIRREVRDAQFAIVGRRPSLAVQRLQGRHGTRVIGGVPDVRSWLAAADVVVAPLRIARGIQNKLLEAMAMARPVVASSPAFTGLDAEPGRDLLVVDGAREQAKAVAGLLVDPCLAARLAAAGRERVEKAYGWDRQLKPLGDMLGLAAQRAAA